MVELKPVACGCGGKPYVSINGFIEYHVVCALCGMRTGWFRSETEAITAWNKSMSERMAKVEKVDMNSSHNQVYKCCKCGQYMHKTAWSRGVVYCSSCGAKLEWE